MDYGQRARQLREGIGVGIRELAAILGVNKSYWSRVERGEQGKWPAPKISRALATATGGDYRELLRLSGRGLEATLELIESDGEILELVWIASAMEPEERARLREAVDGILEKPIIK